MFKAYSEFFNLVKDFVKDAVLDYVNYKKAQRVLWKYDKRDNFCTASGIMNECELEALLIVSEHERIQKNRIETKFRIRNSKKTAL